MKQLSSCTNLVCCQVAAAFIEKGVPPILQELLQVGQKTINAGDHIGRTPLHYAVLNGNVELVTLLLKHGADTNQRVGYHEPKFRTSSENYAKWNKLYSEVSIYVYKLLIVTTELELKRNFVNCLMMGCCGRYCLRLHLRFFIWVCKVD